MIKIRNIRKQHDDLLVLDKLSLDILKGKTTVLLGPSGCGKTTLLNILAGLDRQFSGSIDGMPDKSVISYSFQEDRLLNWKNLKENIEFVLENKKTAPDRLDRYLLMLELSGYKNYPVGKLSGGMRQRAAIARALVYPSEIIFMDEPFQSLDYSLKLGIISHLNKILTQDRRTAVLVTHEINDALLMADVVYVLSDKPAHVVKKKNIPVSKEKRNLHSREFIEIKEEILEYI